MKKLLFIISGILLITSASAQSAAQKMDELVSAYAKENKFNGVVLVAHKGRVLLQKGYGNRNVENNMAHDAESIFQIGDQ